jgi:hypothetical protein
VRWRGRRIHELPDAVPDLGDAQDDTRTRERGRRAAAEEQGPSTRVSHGSILLERCSVSPESQPDWYVAAIDRIENAADELRASLDTLVERLGVARAERLAGVSLVEIVDHLVANGGLGTRRAPSAAFDDFERALAAYRARAVRALVDDAGMTFSAIGKNTGVSRQMIARLYRAADD